MSSILEEETLKIASRTVMPHNLKLVLKHWFLLCHTHALPAKQTNLFFKEKVLGKYKISLMNLFLKLKKVLCYIIHKK